MAEPVTEFRTPSSSSSSNDRPLPAEVILRADELEVAFTPRELRMVKDTLGRSWSQITGDETTDEKFVVQAWLKLRREGYEVELGALDDVVIRVDVSEVDPTSAELSMSSPPSAGSGE